MGFTPLDVDDMSIWQFSSALEGYAKAHDPDADKRLTDAEADELWEVVQGA